MRIAGISALMLAFTVSVGIAADPSPEAIRFLQEKMEEIKGIRPPSASDMESPPPRCGTPVTVAIHAMRERGIPVTLEALTARPTYLPDTLGGDKILIHYAATGIHAPFEPDVDTLPPDGVPDFINRVLEVFEYVWDYELDTLGYATPPSDQGRGGDDRYDVYVENLGYPYYGFTSIDDGVEGHQVSSFISIENDFDGGFPYPPGSVDAVKVTAAHEFFHAIQFGYDALEFDFDNPDDPGTYKPWWLEASSVWMEDIIYDDINDYIGYLPYFYWYPWMGLGTFSYGSNPRAYHPYGSCVWPIFLTEKYGIAIIKEIWEECASVAGYNALHAMDSSLRSRSSSLSKGFLEFSVWNFHTGDLADPTSFYSEGASFPAVDSTIFVGTLTSSPINIGGFPNPPEHLGANFIVIQTSPYIGGVRLDFNGRDLADAEWHVAMLGYPRGDSQWKDIFVVPSTGYGDGAWRNWDFYDNVVVIPTVSGLNPLYGQYDYEGTVAYDPGLYGEGDLSFEFKILPAYPSPFVIGNHLSSMTIPYSLDKNYREKPPVMFIYDVSGRKVRELDVQDRNKGEASGVSWNGKNDNGEYVASGIYIAFMEAEGNSSTLKIAVVNDYK